MTDKQRIEKALFFLKGHRGSIGTALAAAKDNPNVNADAAYDGFNLAIDYLEGNF